MPFYILESDLSGEKFDLTELVQPDPRDPYGDCAERCFGRPRSVDNWSASQILLGQAHNHAPCHSKCHISACAGSALALELIWEHSALMQRQGGAVIEAQKAIFKLDIHSTLSHWHRLALNTAAGLWLPSRAAWAFSLRNCTQLIYCGRGKGMPNGWSFNWEAWQRGKGKA